MDEKKRDPQKEAAPSAIGGNSTGGTDGDQRRAILEAIRAAMPGESGATQCDRLAAALEKLGSVTTLEASRHLDIYDPRARCMTLRRRGWDIKTIREHATTECGARHYIGRYVLASRPVTAVSGVNGAHSNNRAVACLQSVAAGFAYVGFGPGLWALSAAELLGLLSFVERIAGSVYG